MTSVVACHGKGRVFDSHPRWLPAYFPSSLAAPDGSGYVDHGVHHFPASRLSVGGHVQQNGRTYGVLHYGRNNSAMEIAHLVDVRCVRIEDGKAVVGGVRRGSNPAEGWAIFFVDTGVTQLRGA